MISVVTLVITLVKLFRKSNCPLAKIMCHIKQYMQIMDKKQYYVINLFEINIS